MDDTLAMDEDEEIEEEADAEVDKVLFDLLVTVGPLAARMAPAFGAEVVLTADAEAAAAAVAEQLQPGDTVLVKGSRGVGLEVVAQRLQGGRDA